ncbi:hypothetical protein AK830_g3882 [Neonectria ditissima]|uniref:Uncharacterized protein n=1 Tax=Neonectria ditissima TaxID=78410 RepID=A0A0P7BH49_9HYPO|nr:hypothetical protein AK830_g3882 [Neonectria ditissima]
MSSQYAWDEASHFWEPQVLYIACDQSTGLQYLRLSCGLSTFLRRTRESSADLEIEAADTTSERANALRRHLTMQHPSLAWSSFQVHPALDILWLGHFDSLDEVAGSYGQQLDNIENVLVQDDGLWADLQRAAEVLMALGCLRVVYVLVAGHRAERRGRVQELMGRDQVVVKSHGWQIEYIDLNCKSCGTLSYP